MSGSERKQLHITCGVVAGASLVFLDEPTTGLDSCSALNIMLFLKGMATQQGATLLASVHQPRSVIWSQLDQVGNCLRQKGGQFEDALQKMVTKFDEEGRREYVRTNWRTQCNSS
jgi:ABC-type multidrug transport system ATPase subunit